MLNRARYILQYKSKKFGEQLLMQFSTKSGGAQVQTESTKNAQCFKFRDSFISTHPNLLQDGELMPGIKLEEFQKRRNDLMQRILSLSPDEHKDKRQLIIIPAATKSFMSENIPYVFRQNSNFLYFTGCNEPDALLVLSGKKDNFSSILFVKQIDEKTKVWEGVRTCSDTAPAMFGVEQSLPLPEFDNFFLSFVKNNKDCLVWYDSNSIVQPQFHRRLCELMQTSDIKKFFRPTNLIHNMRVIKSEGEVNLMKKSCDIISDAFIKTIQSSKPGMNEHELFARVDYHSRINGAQYLAYPPVVAGGNNATIIHYINNDQIVPDQSIVLMDAGCDYYGYSSDVTRTWPINGNFTEQQKVLYEIVLQTQKALIEKLAEMPGLDNLFVEMNLLLGKGLQDIGLIPKDFGGSQFLEATYKYCPHHVSHYLGMDVHDTGSISRNIKLQPGMVVTVEPGLYISHRNQYAPPEFRGIGIRIEDDVFITENGPVILSENCPKELSDMEKLASNSI